MSPASDRLTVRPSENRKDTEIRSFISLTTPKYRTNMTRSDIQRIWGGDAIWEDTQKQLNTDWSGRAHSDWSFAVILMDEFTRCLTEGRRNVWEEFDYVHTLRVHRNQWFQSRLKCICALFQILPAFPKGYLYTTTSVIVKYQQHCQNNPCSYGFTKTSINVNARPKVDRVTLKLIFRPKLPLLCKVITKTTKSSFLNCVM